MEITLGIIIFIFLIILVGIISWFDKAIELAYGTKGSILGSLNRFEEAMICFDRILEINPKSEKAWYGKGLALTNFGRLEEAIVCYDTAIEINPKYEDAWNNKGAALAILARFEEAMTCFDKVLEINPKDNDAKMNKKRLLNMQKTNYIKEKSATKTYSNDKYGFSIKYPQDWLLDILDPKPEFTVQLNVWFGFQGKVACSIMVGPIKYTRYGRTIQELENRATISRQGLNAQLILSKYLTIDGIDAYEHVYFAEHPNRYVKQVGLFKDNNEYLLLFKVFLKENFEKYEQIFDEIIQSIRFKNP